MIFYEQWLRLSDRGPFDQKSVDRNCVFSVDQNFDNQLTDFGRFSVDQKIWSTAKKQPTDFGSWLKLFKSQNTIIRTFDQLPKKNLRILAVDRNFLNEFKLIELVLRANF